MKHIASIVLAVALLVTTANAVAADGETKVTEKEVCTTAYGGATECKTEKVTEEVVHTTVNAGLGDYPLTLIAAIMAAMGGALYTVSLYAKRV
jgi:hypothetical protein